MKHLKLFIICILVLMSGRLNAQTFDVGAPGAFSFEKNPRKAMLTRKAIIMGCTHHDKR